MWFFTGNTHILGWVDWSGLTCRSQKQCDPPNPPHQLTLISPQPPHQGFWRNLTRVTPIFVGGVGGGTQTFFLGGGLRGVFDLCWGGWGAHVKHQHGRGPFGKG